MTVETFLGFLAAIIGGYLGISILIFLGTVGAFMIILFKFRKGLTDRR